MGRKKIVQKTKQTAPEKKIQVVGDSTPAQIPRRDQDDDLRFLQTREETEETTLDPLSTSARADRMKMAEGDVAFFSRFKNDEVLYEPSVPIQLGPNKWALQPPRWIRFNDRVFTTGDKAIIKYLRDHPRYGFEILEMGKPEHVARIKLYDDGGRMSNIDKLHKLAKLSEKRWAAGIDDG